jgi:sporulation protein YlmC with PRC-barrel domain
MAMQPESSAGRTPRSTNQTQIIRDPDDQPQGPGPDVMDADTLCGDSVVNGAGEDVGKLEAIMLDVRSGRVAYAVLSFGGFLGMGSKLFAVPWGALTLDTVNKRFVLDVDKERLENAEGFDKDHWPSMADREWATRLHEYYSVRPYWNEESGGMRPATRTAIGSPTVS